jgi:outer membrane protein assembly factor BamB
MADLEIIRPNGTRERLALRKKSALMIGTRDSNDIRIGGDDAGAVHCRIAFQKVCWRVSAVTLNGVEINGQKVEAAELVPGDVIRAGDTRLVFHEDTAAQTVDATPADLADGDAGYNLASPPAPNPREAASPDLRPITEENLPLAAIVGHKAAKARMEKRGASAIPGAVPAPALPPKPVAEVLLASAPVRKPVDQPVSEDEFDNAHEERSGDRSEKSDSPADPGKPPRRLVRPGEEDLARSPLIIGLFSTAVILFAGSITFYFWAAQNRRDQALAEAQTAFDTGQFAQAVTRWEEFLKLYPSASEVPKVLQNVAKARVEQFVSGAAPDWSRANKSLAELITAFKDRPEFRDATGELRGYVVKTAGRIAVGAGQATLRLRRPAEFEEAHVAARLVELWSSVESPPTELLAEIDKTLKAARAALTEQTEIDALLKQIDGSLAAKSLTPSAETFRELLQRFPSSSSLKPIQTRLAAIRRLANELAQRDTAAQSAQPFPQAPELVSVWLGRRQRLRSDEVSAGTGVPVWVGDTLARVDRVTGDLLWRRPLGESPPFFPQVIPGRETAWLAWSSRTSRLVQLKAETGEVLWSQTLPGRPLGSPLHYEGQLYVSTSGGRLVQIDAETGEQTTALTFGQELAGPPAVAAAGERLVVVGERGLVYVLNRRPLGLAGVHWLGQGPDTIRAEPVVVRDYVLLAENSAPRLGKLRLLKLDSQANTLREIASLSAEGEVRQAPVLRGKELFVPLHPEGVLAVTLAETDDASALTRRALYRSAIPHLGPVSLLPGPDDQVWMAGSAVRRLLLGQAGLEAAKPELGLGQSTQPAVHFDESLFVGRKLPSSDTVLLGRIERRQMVGQWQLSLGGGWAALSTPQADGATVVVNRLGELFRIGAARWDTGGIDLQGIAQLTLPEGLETPLLGRTLADGRLAIACGLPQPLLWVITPESGSIAEAKLAEPPQVAPVGLAVGLCLPLPGKLALITPTGERLGDDWLAPLDGNEPVAWRELIRLSDGEVAGLLADGTLIRFEVRKDPVTHLAKVTERRGLVAPGSPVVLSGDNLAALGPAGQLLWLDARTLETKSEVAGLVTGTALPGGPWVVGDQILVSPDLGRLQTFAAETALRLTWEASLPPEPLSGSPVLHAGRIVITTRNGQLMRLDSSTGEVPPAIDLGRQLVTGPFSITGDRLAVGCADGSFLVLPTP